VYKVASTAQLANSILLHFYSLTVEAPSLRDTNKNFITYSFLMSWHNSIFEYNLRTIEAENP